MHRTCENAAFTLRTPWCNRLGLVEKSFNFANKTGDCQVFTRKKSFGRQNATFLRRLETLTQKLNWQAPSSKQRIEVYLCG